MVNKKQLLEKAYREGVKLLAVSFGLVTVSLLLSFGITLIIGEIYWGIVPLVVGYELLRWVVKYLWKYQIGHLEVGL